MPPALQLAHYDADAHSQAPPSPAHSGSGSRGPPSFGGSENGDASPPLVRKPIDARLSDLPVQSPTSQKDDRYSSSARTTPKTGSAYLDNEGHVSRPYQEPADVTPSYPYQGSYEPETGGYYQSGRKPSASGL